MNGRPDEPLFWPDTVLPDEELALVALLVPRRARGGAEAIKAAIDVAYPPLGQKKVTATYERDFVGENETPVATEIGYVGEDFSERRMAEFMVKQEYEGLCYSMNYLVSDDEVVGVWITYPVSMDLFDGRGERTYSIGVVVDTIELGGDALVVVCLRPESQALKTYQVDLDSSVVVERYGEEVTDRDRGLVVQLVELALVRAGQMNRLANFGELGLVG